MRFVDANGLRTHVATWDPPQAVREGARDVLLIHGASSDMAVFKPTVIPGLKDRYRVAAYDRPGLGFTATRPDDADQLAVQANVAAGVIGALGLEKPIIVAHSFGGAVALRLALDHPDKVGGLVLIAPVAYDWPGGVSWHLYWSSNPIVGGLFNHVVTRPFAKSAVKSGLAAAFSPSPVPPNYFEDASVDRAATPRAMNANGHDLVAAKREVVAQQGRYAAELTMPIAVLAGDSDTVVRTDIHSQGLKDALPGVRLEILPGVGHLPHETDPKLLQDLVDWVAQRANKPSQDRPS